MTKKYSTKRALVASVLTLALCFSMLVGTTFAWFTDSVTSANNIITSGNLNIELYYQNDETKTWTKVTDKTNVFKDSALWEPGHTEVVKLKVVNEGTLALKYQLGVNVADEVGSTNVNGESFKLSEFIKYGIVEGDKTYTRDEAVSAVDKTATALTNGYNSGSVSLLVDDAATEVKENEKIVTMVVYMPTSVGNDANAKAGAATPTINLGINVFATQLAYEEDSFDKDYDVNSAVFSVKEANEQMAMGLDVTLVNCNEPSAILFVPAGYTGKLTLDNTTVASIQELPAAGTIAAEEGSSSAAASATNIVILGNVTVKATEDEMSAITGTNINISGSGVLTAIGKGNNAFGIGGMTTESITISGITVNYVEGGHAGGVGADTKYYKDAPEGGAAIGSGYNGAVITLDKVTVNKAVGGSKAAAIGARYWTGVTVNIKDSVIHYAEGGVSAAGIGGSRVSSNCAEDGTTINITNSTVTAKGGAYGAGIGSGYDTHCMENTDAQPLCTINIEGSTINATGGKYAAGVGTGYHNAALAGEIKGSTVNAVSGEKYYKASYSTAMDIGFGIVDPAREGKQDCSITVDGKKLTYKDAPAGAKNDEELKGSLTDGADTVYVTEGTYSFPAANLTEGDTIICSEGATFTGTSSLNIGGATVVGGTFTNASGYAASGTINGTFKNCVFDSSEALRWCYSNAGDTVVFENCTFKTDFRGIHFDAMEGDVKFIGCEINGFNAFGGSGTVTFEGCTFGYDESYYNGLNLYTNTVITDCTFIYKSNKSNFIDMEGTGKTLTITNCKATLNGEAANVIDFVGGSKLKENTVTVEGVSMSKVSDGLYTDTEGNYYVYNAAGLQSLKNWMDSNAGSAFWGKTYSIMADIDATTVTWNTKHLSPDSSNANGITFLGNGYKISNLTINGQGLFTGATKGGNSTVVTTFSNITFDNATVTGGSHHNGLIWGEAYGSLTLDKVNVINSKISGGCNVGGLVGRNSESHAIFTFKDCSVKNTTVEATKKADNSGASAFLGMALHIGTSCSAQVVFEGTNVEDGNTFTTASGMQGGGIYTTATWGDTTWDTPVVVSDFTNYDSNN